MKFHSPTGQPIHVALTSGQTANVTADGVELEARFHREAIARGCVPGMLKDVAEDAPAAAEPPFSRPDIIAKALQDMLDGHDPDDFKKDGTPDLRQVSKRVGFQVQRDEVEAAWAEANKG